MPDQKKSTKVQTGNPPAGRLSSYTYTPATFVPDAKKAASKSPKK